MQKALSTPMVSVESCLCSARSSVPEGAEYPGVALGTGADLTQADFSNCTQHFVIGCSSSCHSNCRIPNHDDTSKKQVVF